MPPDCQTCGASFRVDFSVQETQAEGGQVPDGLVEEVNAHTCRRRGTDHVPARGAVPAWVGLRGRRGGQAP